MCDASIVHIFTYCAVCGADFRRWEEQLMSDP